VQNTAISLPSILSGSLSWVALAFRVALRPFNFNNLEELMKKISLVAIALAMITLTMTACWNPSVKAVAITAPWDKMDLPVKDNAIVWESDPKKLKVALKAGKSEVGEAFLKALEKNGWKMSAAPDMRDTSHFFEFAKDGQKLKMEVYDFQNTGVILDLE